MGVGVGVWVWVRGVLLCPLPGERNAVGGAASADPDSIATRVPQPEFCRNFRRSIFDVIGCTLLFLFDEILRSTKARDASIFREADPFSTGQSTNA